MDGHPKAFFQWLYTLVLCRKWITHAQAGFRVDGKRFFGVGWFGAGGMQGVGAGLPPNAFIPFIATNSGGTQGFTVSDE